MMENEGEDNLPKWLKKQQHQNWQIEILITGGFIQSAPFYPTIL